MLHALGRLYFQISKFILTQLLKQDWLMCSLYSHKTGKPLLINSSASESWVVAPDIGNILGFHPRKYSINSGQALSAILKSSFTSQNTIY